MHVWFLTVKASYWLETDILPIAYGYEYQDPTCPAAKIPIRIFETVVIVLALLIDILFFPIYLIAECIQKPWECSRPAKVEECAAVSFQHNQ
jgi:hypothetical protein